MCLWQSYFYAHFENVCYLQFLGLMIFFAIQCRDHIDYMLSRYRSRIRRACDNRSAQMSYDIVQERTHANTPSIRQCRTAIIISTMVISCCLKGPKQTATQRQSIAAPSTHVQPSLVVPSLATIHNIVTAALTLMHAQTPVSRRESISDVMKLLKIRIRRMGISTSKIRRIRMRIRMLLHKGLFYHSECNTLVYVS